MTEEEELAQKVHVIKLVGEESPFTGIRSLLDFLRDHTGLIGRPSVENLYSFLYGFAYAKANTGNLDALDFLSSFNQLVRQRYKIETTQGWGKIIEFFSPDESSSISLFWKLYDDFLSHQKN